MQSFKAIFFTVFQKCECLCEDSKQYPPKLLTIFEFSQNSGSMSLLVGGDLLGGQGVTPRNNMQATKATKAYITAS